MASRHKILSLILRAQREVVTDSSRRIVPWTRTIKNVVIKYWPFIFFLCSPLIYAFAYFFKGRIPFPSSYVANDLGPWNKYLGQGFPVKNGIPDVPGEIFPMRSLVMDLWEQGIVPLWNPYVFSGNPLLANFQSAVFFPFNFLFLLLPRIDAWSLLVISQPVLAGLFTYLFVRSLKIKKVPAVVSGIAFMFCGFLTVWNTYLTLGFTILFLPLALYLTEKFFQKKKTFLLPLLTLVLAASFFSGHIQTWAYLFFAVVVYGSIKFILLRKEISIKNLLFWVVFLFLTVLLISLQLFPTLEFYSLTGRSLVATDPKSVGIPLRYLVTLFSPDFFGNPVTRNDWFGTYAEWSSYFGLIALIFSLAGIFSIKGHKEIVPVFSLVLLGFFLAVRTPIIELLTQLPFPILNNSNPARAIVILSFSLSVFAAFGFDLFLTEKKYFAKTAKSALTVSLVLILLLFYILFGGLLHLPEAENLRQISLRNLSYSFFVLFGFWIALFLYRLKKLRNLAVFLIVALVIFESVRFYAKWTPFDIRMYAYPDNKISRFLMQQNDYKRYYGQFGQTSAYLYHLFSTEGYEPLNLKSYTMLLSSTVTGKPEGNFLLLAKLQSRDKYSKELMDLLGVRYLIFPANELDNSFNFPILSYPKNLYPKIFDDGKYAVFENKESLPRAALFYDYKIVTDHKTISTMFSEQIDLKTTLVLTEDPQLNFQKDVPDGLAVITTYTPNEIKIKVKSSQDALLFLSDNYYPGWQAFVNGMPVKIYQADYTFRSIKIPAGKSIVIFKYNPLSFRIGLILSLITLLFLSLFLIVSLVKRK